MGSLVALRRLARLLALRGALRGRVGGRVSVAARASVEAASSFFSASSSSDLRVSSKRLRHAPTRDPSNRVSSVSVAAPPWGSEEMRPTCEPIFTGRPAARSSNSLPKFSGVRSS